MRSTPSAPTLCQPSLIPQTTSRSFRHWRFQDLLSLQNRELRDSLGSYFGEGLRFAYSALSSDAQIIGYAWCPELLRPHAAGPILDRLRSFPSIRLTAEQFRLIEFAPEPQGLVLVLRQRTLELSHVKLGKAAT